MNRIFAGVMLLVGMLLIALSVTKVIPGATGSGIGAIFAAIVVFGLSFVPRPETEGVSEMSAPNRLINIFISPGELFENLRHFPKPALAIAVSVVAVFVYSTAFMRVVTPERIVNHTTDKTLEMGMVRDNVEAVREIEKGRAVAIEIEKNPAKQAISVFGIIGSRTFATLAAACIFLVILLAFGARANFWQIFAAVAWAGVPDSVLRYGLSLIVLFFKDPIDIHPILGQQAGLIAENLGFLVSTAEHPVLYVLLSSISALTFYWIWLNSLGLAKAGQSVSRGAALAATLGLWLFGVIFGTVMALAFPSFFQ